jgi:short-subunit dehydrogenase
MMPEISTGKALVTGASAGIGETFARELAKRRYDLILTARRLDRLEQLSHQLARQYNIHCEVLAADLAIDDGLETVAARIRQTPDLTMLVNNAGFGTIGDFADVDIEKHLSMINVHVKATVRLCHAALPGMVSNRRGDIINVSSVSGFMDNPGGTTYNSTKAYLNTFSRTLYNEVEEHGLRVQALCPGFTRTEFHEASRLTDFVNKTVPQSWWLSSEYVVKKSLKALEKKQVICIPHIRYKFIVALYRNRVIARLMRPIVISKSRQKRKILQRSDEANK